MRVRGPGAVGAVMGVIAATLVLGFSSGRVAQFPGPILGEHGGMIRSVVMQYTRGSSFVWPIYRQFLREKSSDFTVYLVCPEQPDFDELQRAIGRTNCLWVPILTGHEMTPWARDRWVNLLPGAQGEPITLLAGRGELEQDIWPARVGDSRIAGDIARILHPGIVARRSSLYFDGGDLLCDDRFVFITRAVVQRNVQQTVHNRQELLDILGRELHREVIVMDEAPDHHAGMYMMAAGNHRMLVGDPSMGLALFDRNTPITDLMEGGPDASKETQRRFDSVAKLARNLGYDVRRIPTVPGMNGKQYLTFVNVIMDERGGHSIVYMPTYDGQPRLNAAARRVWESIGYKVVLIDCTSAWSHGGTLHCLVNVLKRDS